MFSFIKRIRSRKISIPAFGGEIREPTISPQGVINGFGRTEFILLFLLILAISLSVLNVGLSLIAQHKADATPYVADGTPFGCQVVEMIQ